LAGPDARVFDFENDPFQQSPVGCWPELALR
jgi:hypothetical protein